jgi:hypothetical protein
MYTRCTKQNMTDTLECFAVGVHGHGFYPFWIYNGKVWFNDYLWRAFILSRGEQYKKIIDTLLVEHAARGLEECKLEFKRIRPDQERQVFCPMEEVDYYLNETLALLQNADPADSTSHTSEEYTARLEQFRQSNVETNKQIGKYLNDRQFLQLAGRLESTYLRADPGPF